MNAPEWVEIAEPHDGWVELEAPDPEVCPIGFEGHTWNMVILEGALDFEPRERCTGACRQVLDSPEYIGELRLGVVRLKWVNECDNPGGWHYDTPCDHGSWITPTVVEPGDWPQHYTDGEVTS